MKIQSLVLRRIILNEHQENSIAYKAAMRDILEKDNIVMVVEVTANNSKNN